MARLKKQVLGTVSGAVGDILFRVRNGNTFVGTRPASFMPGMDTASVNRRMRFALTTKLCRTINSVPELKTIWRAVTPSRLTQYNMMVKLNYNNVSHNNVSGFIKLVPEIGFGVTVTSIIIDSANLEVELQSIGTNSGIDPVTETYFKLAGVMVLSDPTDPQNAPFTFMRVIFEDAPLDISNPLNFQVAFMDQISQLISQYQVQQVFLTLLTLDINKNPVQYSNTFFNS
jgi:hypothetical protein